MKDKILLFLAKYVFGFLVRILKFTIRFELISPDYLGEIIIKGEGCILIFWHGGLMIPMMYYTDRGIYVLVSQHKDGEIIARILKGLGCNLIRGSSSKGGKKVLLEMVNLLKKNNIVAITPDGPKGPYRKLKIGAISLAQKSGCPIIPISVSARNKKILKSWDRFVIVLPFTKCLISYDKPIYVKDDLGKEDLEKVSMKIEKKILYQNREIEKYFTKEKLNKIGERKIYTKFILTILLPFSYIYGLILVVREYLYKKNIFKTRSLSRPVISVGNLTLGGTGKTPLTIWLAEYFKKNGYKSAILTRGYKGRSRNKKIIINDKNLLYNNAKIGDEPLLMAKKLEDVPVIIGKNRYNSAILGEKNFKPDVYILDDGFQHIKLRRDLNILLLNGDMPFDNGKLFPSGSLREPIKSIKKADVIIITKIDNSSEEIIHNVRDYSSAPIFFMNYSVLGLKSFDGDKLITPEQFSSLKSIAFSGIANHKHFIETILKNGIEIIDYVRFSDHHYYKKKDIKKIISLFIKSQVDVIITTGKDAVKINSFIWKPYPFYYLDINVEIKESRKFEEIVINVLKGKSCLLSNL
jgi:tetraacyldisaccharide 4'-kinase